MLRVYIKEELFNNETQEFSHLVHGSFDLEHSLVSLSKWESIHQKPFLSDGEKTTEEYLSYLRAMLLRPDVPEELLSRMTEENWAEINAYVNSPQTATIIRQRKKPGPKKIITSELIYSWMVGFNIPFECQHWHLNRLLTLIQVCGLNNSKPEKMSREEAIAEQRRLNAERKARLGTSG